MARKLPWATGNADISKYTIKRESRDSTTPVKRPERRRRQSTPPSSGLRPRSRSSSPPKAPPAVEPMVEGFDQDDIWMMVDDEFNEVAKKFAAHLHHAEYKRRKEAVKRAGPKPLPLPVSPMSKGTKRRLEQDLLHARQNGSIEALGIERKATASDDQADDPWRGTPLAAVISGRQERVSLKGLDRLPSATRAAQGFERANRSDGAQSTSSTNPYSTSGTVVSESTQIEALKIKEPRISRPRPEQQQGEKAKSERHSPPTSEDATLKPRSLDPTTKRNSSGRTVLKRKKLKKEQPLEDQLAEMPMWL